MVQKVVDHDTYSDFLPTLAEKPGWRRRGKETSTGTEQQRESLAYLIEVLDDPAVG